MIYASAWDIEYVSIYRFLNHDAAYAIVSFKSHRNAALARRKLRPERLFKCNEVHVEWARVDWNPSNVVSGEEQPPEGGSFEPAIISTLDSRLSFFFESCVAFNVFECMHARRFLRCLAENRVVFDRFDT